MSNQLRLVRSRRFLPLFATQICSGLNDNLFKSGFVMLVTYGGMTAHGIDAGSMAAIAGAALIAPFFLFSAWAGELADRFERARLLRLLKALEVVAVLGAAAALLIGNLAVSLVLLFLLGAQATFSGPIKYALLPQYLAADELVDGNAVMEGGTFLAILLGTIGGGIAIAFGWGREAAALLLIACAVCGFVASLFLPPAPAPSPRLRLSWNQLAATGAILRHARERRDVWLSILGASWFWLVGAVFLSQIPSFAKATLGAESSVVTLFLAAFSVGVGIGSSLCGRLMGGEISARYVPLAALGMALFSLDLALASEGAAVSAGPAFGIVGFLSRGVGLRILVDMVGVAVSGGFFVVPLYAIIQRRSDEAARARIVAANNIVNALFMTGAALVTAALLHAGFAIPDVFLVLAVIGIGVALWICKLLPQDVLRMIGRLLFKLAYRVEVSGLAHLASAGDRVVIVPNHVSFLDGALLASFLPGSPMFAIDPAQTRKWWVRPLLAGAEIYMMDPARPMMTKSLIKALREEGGRCVIFPEGRLNRTGGALMKVYDGPAMVADKAEATVLPVRLDGIELTPFTRLKGRVRRRWFPRVTITIMEPRLLGVPALLRGRARRHAAGLLLYDVMSDMMARRPDPPTLFGALLAARDMYGDRQPVLADPLAEPLGYKRIIMASLVLGRRLSRGTAFKETVGLMLPNSTGAALAFVALQATGRVPAMINYTSGADAVLSACRTAQLRRVVTSRRFVEQAKLQPLVEHLGALVELVWLEDVRARIGLADRLWALVATPLAGSRHRRLGIAATDPAVILFTSGSEGAPKGVALSHANLLTNRRQIAARIDFSPADQALNALPLFHSFGLTGGFLLPLLSGVPLFLYPSPLHYRIVPEIAYDIAATILFGTDTFLAGYARAAHPYDFYALRYVFAGAEPVREETRRVWAERFGKRILEGYGVTECAPVIALNTPMHNRTGTVGRLLPRIAHRLEPIEGIDAGGRLFVRGPNIMLGYLWPDRPGILAPPEEGWHDTGDIVSIDPEGYVTIAGRAKRFAKIGGEMISLAVAERIASAARPDARHAVVALPDVRRGERLVLITEAPDLDRTALAEAAHREALPELALPRDIMAVERLPLLGSGKVDYPATLRLAMHAAAADPEEDAGVEPAALSTAPG